MFSILEKAEYYEVWRKFCYNAAFRNQSRRKSFFLSERPRSFGPAGGKREAPGSVALAVPAISAAFFRLDVGYIYAVKNDSVYINLYTNSKVTLDARVETSSPPK